MQSITLNHKTGHSFNFIVEVLEEVGMKAVLNHMDTRTLCMVQKDARSELDLVYRYLRKAEKDLIIDH